MRNLMARLANNKRCKIWKEATVASFVVLPECGGGLKNNPHFAWSASEEPFKPDQIQACFSHPN